MSSDHDSSTLKADIPQDRQTTIKEALLLEEAKQDLQQYQKLPTTSNRREVLLRAKARLEEARAMRHLTTPASLSSSLPPISALQTPLVIQNIDGPEELVRFQQHDNDAKDEFEAIRQEEATATEICSSKKRKFLQENLLLLKRKLSVLKETKSKRIRLEEAQRELQEAEEAQDTVVNEAVVVVEETTTAETKKGKQGRSQETTRTTAGQNGHNVLEETGGKAKQVA
jgi:hypothetical protein